MSMSIPTQSLEKWSLLRSYCLMVGQELFDDVLHVVSPIELSAVACWTRATREVSRDVAR